MLKKFFSLLIVFTLVLPACVKANDISSDIEYKSDILLELNIMPENPMINNQGYIGKSDFINYICNILGDYGYTADNAEEAILLAEQLGVIKDRTDGTNAYLKYEEALTMLVRVLGYESIAEAKGGFPSGYIQVARTLGVCDGVTSTAEGFVKKYQAVQLLYNVLDINIASILAVNIKGDKQSVVYDTTTNETLLYAYRKIYKVEGILETSGIAGLRSAYNTKDGYISIDGKFYVGTGYDDLLGYRVFAYIKESENEDSIIYMDQIQNSSLLIEGKDVMSVSPDFSKLTYINQKGKEETISLSAIVSVIYNGLPYSGYTEATFQPDDGNVKLIDNDIDGVYDVVNITSYKTVVIDSISRLDKTVNNIYSFNTENRTVNLETDEDNYITIVKDGINIQFNDLSRLDVLRIAEITSNDIRKVYVEVSRNVATGVVEEIRNTDDGQQLIVAGQELYMSDAFEDAVAGFDSDALSPQLNQSYNFHLDDRGKIAYVAKGEKDLKYAIVKQYRSDGVFETRYQLKVFTSDGNWEVLTLNDKVECNGEEGVAAEAVKNKIVTLQNADVVVVMGYQLNADGEVIKTELPLLPGSDFDKERMNIQRRTNIGYKNNTQSFMSQIFVDSEAIIWEVDMMNLADEASYSAESRSVFVHNNFYSFSAYNVDEFNFANVFVIERNEATIAKKLENSDLFVVTGIGGALNVSGKPVNMVTGAMGSYDSVSWFTDDDTVISGLNEGDIICAYADKLGNVTHIEKHYSSGDTQIYKEPSPNLLSSAAIFSGKILKNDLEGQRIKVNCTGTPGSGEYVFRTNGSFSVLVYDTQAVGKKVHFGTIGDVMEKDFVVAKIKEGVLYNLIVIR